MAAGLMLALLPALAAADTTLTIPKGTSVDVVLQQPLDSSTAKVNHTFRAKLVEPLYVEGQMALPADTIVNGRVDAVKSLREGARSGFISIKFVSIELPNGEKKDIEAKLISLRQDERLPVVAAPKVDTPRKVDVVLIGRATPADGRAHTLVGENAAEDFSRTSLSESEVEVASGTLLRMEFDQAVKLAKP